MSQRVAAEGGPGYMYFQTEDGMIEAVPLAAWQMMEAVPQDPPEYVDLDRVQMSPVQRERVTVKPEAGPMRVTLTHPDFYPDPDFTSEVDAVLMRNEAGKPVVSTGRDGSWLLWCATPPNQVVCDGALFELRYKYTLTSNARFYHYLDRYRNGLRIMWAVMPKER